MTIVNATEILKNFQTDDTHAGSLQQVLNTSIMQFVVYGQFVVVIDALSFHIFSDLLVQSITKCEKFYHSQTKPG